MSAPDPHDPLPTPTPADGDATRYPGKPADSGATGYGKPDEHATRYSAAPVDADATGYTPTPTDCRRPAARRTLPCQFGDYELLEEIARGGMGVVYKARQRIGEGERLVALKMIPAGRLASPEAVERFLQEARAAATLDHPGIVPIFDIGECDERHYFTMPLLTGGSLADRAREGPLPPREAASVVRQVAEAVQHAHEHGIIHRDLKPANILLAGPHRSSEKQTDSDGSGEDASSSAIAPSRDGLVAKVTDFGLARTRESELSLNGEVMGTPSYMPPEQARGQIEAIGPTCDVYGLGAVLYCLLTGRPPFQSSTSEVTMRQVCEDEPVPPRQLNGSVPPDLQTICLKCLHKEPTGRYPRAADLAADLAHWLAGEPIVARPVGRIERAGKWVRRRPVIAALSAAVVVAMVLGTSVSLHFGMRARQKEKEALGYAESLEEMEKETRQAREEVEEHMAVGLLRPLGHVQYERPLNDVELEALEELAGLRKKHDRVRVLFIRLALNKQATARQLGRRLEESLIAAVGFRQDLRQQAIQEAAFRLEDSSTPYETKIVCARLVAQLRCEQTNVVFTACDTLVARMALEFDTGRLLAKAFDALAGRLSPDQASVLADRIVKRADKATDRNHQASLLGAFAKLARNVPAEQTVVLADHLVKLAANTGNDSYATTVLSSVFAVLAGKVPTEQAIELADRIVKLARTSDDFFRAEMSKVLAGLAGRLPAEQAAALADRIVGQVGSVTDRYPLPALSETFSVLGRKLSTEQATGLADRIVKRAATETKPYPLLALAEAFAALAGNLPAEQVDKHAARMAGRVVAQIPTASRFDVHTLTKAFATLGGSLPTEQTGTLADRIQLAAKTANPETLVALAEAFAVLAGKLPADQAGKHAAGVVDRIIELATKTTTNPQNVTTLSQAFVALASKLPAEQASRQATMLACQIVEMIVKHDWRYALLEVFVALVGKLPAKQAPALADRIVGIETNDRALLCSLSQAFVALASKLPAEQVSRQGTMLARRIVEMLVKHDWRSTLLEVFVALVGKLPAEQAPALAGSLVTRIAERSYYDAKPFLSKAFAAVAGKLSAEQAAALADRIVALAKPTMLYTQDLSRAFVSLADKLPAEQARRQASTLAATVFKLSAQTEPVHLPSLWQDFAVLASKLSATEAATLADCIIGLAAKTTSFDILAALSGAFVALPGKRRESQTSALVLRLVRLSHQHRTSKDVLALLDCLLPQLSNQTLIEALKHPGCVGTTRSALLRHLGKRNKRSFHHVWEVVEHLKQDHPDLKLDSPLQFVPFVPEAAVR
jgi:hypothetical protein